MIDLKLDKGILPTEYKYDVVEPGVEIKGKTLYRIIARKDFSDVKEGDLGGYIESGHNLSHLGDCWIYNDATVTGNARVSDNAKVMGNAIVKDDARIFGNAMVYGNAKVINKTRVYGNAKVFENASVYNFSKVFENARVYGEALIQDGATIRGNAKVFGESVIYDYANVTGNAKVYDEQHIVFGTVDNDILAEKDWSTALYSLFRIYPINGKVILYKTIDKEWSDLRTPEIVYHPNCTVNSPISKNKRHTFNGYELYFSFPQDIKTTPLLRESDYEKNYFDYLEVAAEIKLRDIVGIIGHRVYVKKAHIIDVIDSLK
jgi:carbonic anhydrase/acetyltransferase-like protein (isoleucine patch superfamily)